MRSTLVATSMALATLGGWAPTAVAGEVTTRESGRRIAYTAGPGTSDRVTVTQRGDVLEIVASAAISVSGGDCHVHAREQVRCPVPDGARLELVLGEGDDTATLDTTLPVVVEGGPGADVLTGGRGAESLLGGAGDDRLRGGPGADRLSGGDGTDLVDYAQLHDPVTVTPEPVARGGAPANDGAAGEGDAVALDVEGAIGGTSADVLAAGPGGGPLTGGPGDDRLTGGAGDDVLDGGPGRDVLAGGDGADRLLLRDGRAEVGTCGAGTDSALADFDDNAAGDCEVVQAPFRPDAALGAPPGHERSGEGSLDDRPSTGTPGQHGRGRDGGAGRDDGGEAGDHDAGGNDRGGNGDDRGRGHAPTGVPATALQAVTPVAGRFVGVAPAQGEVRVKVPARETFEALRTARPLPVGTQVDARNGTVSLRSARDLAGRTQVANFTGAVFTVRQGRSAQPTTVLRLRGGSFAACGRARTAAAGSRPRVVRRLWGSGKGRFSTRGRDSVATVRGTVWLTEDRCGGTFTRVRRGVVAVRELRTGRKVVLRAGQSHLARAAR